MGDAPEADAPAEGREKLQLRYGEEGGEGPLLVFHPLIACLLAGAAAGLAAFALGESTYGAFEAAGVSRRFQGIISDLPTPAARDAAMARGAATAYAGLGGLLGLFQGLAAGLIRGDARRGARGGAAGLVLGTIAGGLLSLGVLPGALKFRDRSSIDPILIGTATQALIWGPIAAAAGAAFGFALGGIKLAPRFAAFALGGALVATLVYGAAGAALFPLAETDRPLAAQRGARLLAHMLVALGAGAAVGLALTGRDRRPGRWPWEERKAPDDAGPATPAAS
ncbi:MAG: hypothetical protein BGO49_30700 [Planctomycetales bacterium 71-10]|nr:MAG: hypothetical protein BGO49_30700 [Planctomycetales bacterium 71-10]